MIEQVFQMAQTDKYTVERVIADDNVHFMHMILCKNEALPEHFSNANVYMAVTRGLLSIGLGEQEIHEYPAGTVLNIPKGIKMNVKNLHDDIVELIVVKAPAPGK